MVIYSLSDIKKILDALSNENRIRILRMLEKKCMCVCEIGYILKIKQPAVTKHMHKLKRSGLVNERKKIPGGKSYPGPMRNCGTSIKTICKKHPVPVIEKNIIYPE